MSTTLEPTLARCEERKAAYVDQRGVLDAAEGFIDGGYLREARGLAEFSVLYMLRWHYGYVLEKDARKVGASMDDMLGQLVGRGEIQRVGAQQLRGNFEQRITDVLICRRLLRLARAYAEKLAAIQTVESRRQQRLIGDE